MQLFIRQTNLHKPIIMSLIVKGKISNLKLYIYSHILNVTNRKKKKIKSNNFQKENNQ